MANVSLNQQTTTNDRDRKSGSRSSGELEKTRITLGFIPLTDCAPLVIALEKGFFAQRGLEVTLSREPSWANIRDKVNYGLLDGAQMLAGMPIAVSLGAEAFKQSLVTGFCMSLNGNAITVSNALHERLLTTADASLTQRPMSAHALKTLIDVDKSSGKKPLRFAMVFPSSSHNYLLRYWLASAGIDPDLDVELTVVPPPQMALHLQNGLIDGYCVGEPWNTRAVEAGFGRVLITSYEIWNNHPEKVFGVSREWADTHPMTHRAILMALIEATQWLDQPRNRPEAVSILARPEYVDTSASSLEAGLLGRFRYGADEETRALPDFHVFHRYAANFPWLSHAEWIMTQMLRWGQLKHPLDIRAAAASVYRPDLYREAAAGLGLSCPPFDRKSEGQHDSPWLLATTADSFEMGPDRFFDDREFDPADSLAYLNSFSMKHEASPRQAVSHP